MWYKGELSGSRKTVSSEFELYAMTTVVEVNSTIRGYHVYKRRWSAGVVGDGLGPGLK